jgi:hypothetical protein
VALTTGHALSENLALTSPTSGGRSVGIVSLRVKATEFSFLSRELHHPVFISLDFATVISSLQGMVTRLCPAPNLEEQVTARVPFLSPPTTRSATVEVCTRLLTGCLFLIRIKSRRVTSGRNNTLGDMRNADRIFVITLKQIIIWKTG